MCIRDSAKALQKKLRERYSSADEMHDAVYNCLIVRGEASYSVFISYRVASEEPLARLLFDELNHSVTPGGHRVTVFWDKYSLVTGEDWEEGFAAGLLHSLCFLPLLSYGSTAPLAALPEDKASDVWEQNPVGRVRLAGMDCDWEDNFLKELMIASALLKERASGSGTESAQLQLAYPILVGRQEPDGHPDYPRMGSFFHVQGGGGRYPTCPSKPTSRAVVNFLRDKVGLSPEALEHVEAISVHDAVKSFTRLQGCQLWNHPKVSLIASVPLD